MPCLNPRTIYVAEPAWRGGRDKGGLAREVACQKCSECRKGRVRDLTGRVLAESKYAVGSHFITLSYGVDRRMGGAVDVKGANVLTYSHCQNWLKRLRNAGYPMRYVLAGEYGSKNGRAHFHCILFWTREVPPVPEHKLGKDGHRRCWNDPFWEPIGGGHTQWAEVNQSTARYVAKYSLKDRTDEHAQGFVRVSTRPLIGAKYFDHWAKLHVDQGLALKNRYYTIDGSVDKQSGKLWQYYMNDAVLRYVLRSFSRQWEAAYGKRHMPSSEWMERQFDKLARPLAGDAPLPKRRYLARPFLATPNGEQVCFDEKRNEYWCELGRTEGGRLSSPVRVWWSFDEKGQRCWSFEFVSVTEGERRWRAYLRAVKEGLSPEAMAYAKASGRLP